MKKVKIIAPIVAILAIITVVVIRFNLSSTAEQPELPPTVTVEKDTDMPMGSEENPFTILEIVPCENQAEVGYLISGCEPIDMEKLAVTQDANGWYRSKFETAGIANVSAQKALLRFPDEIPSGSIIRGWPNNQVEKLMMADGMIMSTMGDGTGEWEATGNNMTAEGYYQLVADKSGTFNLEKGTDGSFRFVSVEKNTDGDYRWVTADNVNNVETDYEAEQVWTERTGYCYSYHYFETTHNNHLVKEIFGDEMNPDEVVSRVITITPYDFRNPDNIELIAQADMIYMHRDDDGSLASIWDKYNVNGKVLTEEERSRNTFSTNDMPWDAVVAIVNRMSGENPAALMIDEAVYNTTDNKNNCHKLLLMLRQYGPRVFKELYLDSGKIVESDVQSNGITTGVYNKNDTEAIIEWAESTFWPDIPDTRPEYLIEAGMKHPSFNTEEGWKMVQDNIYFYNGTKQMLDDFFKDCMEEIPEINEEVFDYYEELWGYRPEKLTPLLVTKYLLQSPDTKRKLKILEVEPCNKFIYGNEGWQEYYLTLFPWFSGSLGEDLTVVTMPTWQFISSIEDLNSEYDAIIFGTKQDISNGLNGYRDASLNYKDGNSNRGLRYISVGDIVTDKTSEVRNVKQERTLRYSGNDITQKKLEELKGFLNAGKPIILDRSFLNRNKQVDTEKIVDQSSNMCQLVSMYGKDVEGVNTGCIFVKGLYQAHKLKKAVAVETCKIQFQSTDEDSGYPTEYEYVPAEDETITNVSYASRNFEYKFKIVGKTNQKYGIDLFIDTNGDGVYDGSKKEKAGKVAGEMVSGIIVKDRNGREVDPHNLTANVPYTLSKTLESNYQGILPWKLEAYKIDNENCRNSVVKYSAVKATAKKEKLRVLLMQPTPDMRNPDEFYKSFGQKEDGTYLMSHAINNTFRMDTMDQFKKYLACVDEFDITLEYLSNDEWCKKFNSTEAQSEGVMIDAWKQYLNNYDMLILGFCDDCTFTGNKIYYEGFMYFVNQGKSVILSHDMIRDTSQNEGLRVAYDEEIRQVLGQRRYFTPNVTINGQEISLLHQSQPELNVSMKDGTVLPGVFDNSTRQFVIFGDVNQADRDAYTNLGSGKWAQSSADSITQYINIINESQITHYPYEIPDVIKVANTHTQNYQLNMEDEDIVVWYGLTDKYTKNYQTQMRGIIGDSYDEDIESPDRIGRGVYSSIESDGRNSFYIYNKGNVTYTGLGHNKRMTDAEVRLFVNTMIAAYRATAAVPSLEVTNEDAIFNEDEVVLYVTFDDTNFNTDNEFLDVHYTVTDPSLVSVGNRLYTLRYYDKDNNIMQVADETGAVGFQKTYIKNTADVLPMQTGNDVVYVGPPGEYYFRVPYQKIKDEGSVEYNVVLTSSYVNANQQNVETMSRTKVIIMPMPLFTLN